MGYCILVLFISLTTKYESCAKKNLRRYKIYYIRRVSEITFIGYAQSETI